MMCLAVTRDGLFDELSCIPNDSQKKKSWNKCKSLRKETFRGSLRLPNRVIFLRHIALHYQGIAFRTPRRINAARESDSKIAHPSRERRRLFVGITSPSLA